MSANDPNKNKMTGKKKISRKKTETKKIVPENVPPTVDADVQSLIKQAFIQFYDKVSIEKDRSDDIAQLNNITTEYLKAYMTIGYDLHGDKVFMMHAANAQDRDALLENLRCTMFNIFNPEQGGMGEGGNLEEDI